MAKRMIIMLAVLGLVFGGIFGWKAYVGLQMSQAMATMKPPPVAVTATEVKPMTWSPTLTADGGLRATQGVNVSTELAGMVETIDFRSGQEVRQDELLAQLDTETEQAQLEEFKAQLALADIQRQRQWTLADQDATSQSEVDDAESQYEQAAARVKSQLALIDKKQIRAPFSGRLGIRRVDIGQYLSPGEEIANLQALDPIYADFTLPEQQLDHVRVGQIVKVRVAAFPSTAFNGRITAINPAVNAATRQFAVEATLRNDEHRLRPGMFANVNVLLPERDRVLTLPQTAITYNPYGDLVYVIQHEAKQPGTLTVHSVFVETGDQRGDQVAVTRGLKPGDQVVTAGQLKLNNGAQIVIDNRLEPSNDPTPDPADS